MPANLLQFRLRIQMSINLMSIGINVERTKIYVLSEWNADLLQFRLRIQMSI